MLSSSYQDLRVGQMHGSRTKTLSQDVIEAFAEISEDRHPLHLDADYAARHRFGKRISHGALVISTFLGIVDLDPDYLVAFYGIDTLRFIRPTFSGDTIHAETEVAEIEPKGDGQTAVVTYKVTVLNQANDPVMAGRFKLLAR